MRIIDQSYDILTPIDGADILRRIDRYARTAYLSETTDSPDELVHMLIDNGHESPLEHISISARILCDRGVSHELVRHRLASYTQESTRYCRYGASGAKELTFIEPIGLRRQNATRPYLLWIQAMHDAQAAYFALLDAGCAPQVARSVLPSSLKTEIIMTANLREWRHVFRLRCAPGAHPQMRGLMMPLLRDMAHRIPVIFDDIVAEVVS